MTIGKCHGTTRVGDCKANGASDRIDVEQGWWGLLLHDGNTLCDEIVQIANAAIIVVIVRAACVGVIR
jgi:hypothetical protein